jgi:hypothetical protein
VEVRPFTITLAGVSDGGGTRAVEQTAVTSKIREIAIALIDLVSFSNRILRMRFPFREWIYHILRTLGE